MPSTSPGRRFRDAVVAEAPLQVVGVINAFAARLAARVGFSAVYLSGGGVSSGSLGVPDLGIITLDDVLTDVDRITNVCDLPLLVDVDTGFGPSAFNIARAVRSLTKAGAAAMHIEDQVATKRCGHRPNKAVVSLGEMCDRIKAAVDARTDPSFVVMARTDALAIEGLEATVARAVAYVDAGADALFPDAVSDLQTYRTLADATSAPVLANITEFGRTPLFTRAELATAGVAIALYPLSAWRAMNAAALKVYTAIHQDGTQKEVVQLMQTRDELYEYLEYEAYEQVIDRFQQEGEE